jgi:hypothetical protein
MFVLLCPVHHAREISIQGRGSTNCAVVSQHKNWLKVQIKIFCFISETTKPIVG